MLVYLIKLVFFCNGEVNIFLIIKIIFLRFNNYFKFFFVNFFILVIKKWYFCNLFISEKLLKLVFVNNYYLFFLKIGIIIMYGYYYYKYKNI